MLKNKKILIVDDNDLNIFALTATLKPKAPILAVAKDGKECIDYLRENPDVDLVLLDMMMPIMDGYETLKIMKSEKKTRSIPVIALTAQAMTGDAEKCIAAGASDYCSKPVDIDSLLDKIYTLLNI